VIAHKPFTIVHSICSPHALYSLLLLLLLLLLRPTSFSPCLAAGPAGLVRVWRLGKQSQTMEASMKDHKGPVNCIVVKASTDDECVSASSDGSCIIWDLNAGRRRQVLMQCASCNSTSQ
jgi:WD40 repeat protein